MKELQLATARGPYKKSAKTRGTIIQAAIDLLIEEGYNGFSLRKIALRAGVSIGRLQHHFSTKELLLSTMLDDVIQGYLDEFETLMCKAESPREQLRTIVKHVIEDLGTKETTRFFPELWSLANHDPRLEELSVSMYDKYQDFYRRIIPGINPNLSEEQIERITLFITASLEGHTIFVGYKKRYNDQIDVIVDMACRSFLHMIETGAVPA